MPVNALSLFHVWSKPLLIAGAMSQPDIRSIVSTAVSYRNNVVNCHFTDLHLLFANPALVTVLLSQ